MRYPKRHRRMTQVRYQASEDRPLFSEKEFIIRSNGKTKVFTITSRLQWCLFMVLLIGAVWLAYSYRMYSVSDKIISYQERKLDETRSAYVDLMSDFVTVHKNISSMMETLGKPGNRRAEEIEDYLKKAEIIEERIRRISANEDWIDEDDLGNQSALKDALIHRDVAVQEKKLLEQKVQHLEGVITSLQALEQDILKRVEKISSKEVDDIKTTISSVNGELKKRGKYFNPLANSKKDSKGGPYNPDILSGVENKELVEQFTKTFSLVDDAEYYKSMIKKIPIGKPVWTYWLSSPFGKRSDPFNAKSAAHKGVDLASNKGNKVKTMAEGKVVKAGTATGYGKVVEIDHGNGFKTKYAHLNAIYVKQGDTLSQGQAIGEVGSTGRSTGPHLHYEILYDGVQADPMVFIKAK